jgi:hypothetical protein
MPHRGFHPDPDPELMFRRVNTQFHPRHLFCRGREGTPTSLLHRLDTASEGRAQPFEFAGPQGLSFLGNAWSIRWQRARLPPGTGSNALSSAMVARIRSCVIDPIL